MIYERTTHGLLRNDVGRMFGTHVYKACSASHRCHADDGASIIVNHTPPVLGSVLLAEAEGIGPRSCEVRIAIGVKDFTTTMSLR